MIRKPALTAAAAPRRIGNRWVFSDGTSLPVIAGGADEGDTQDADDAKAGEPSAASALTDDELEARQAELLKEYDALHDAGDDTDAAGIAKLTEIADELDTIAVEQERRETEKAEAKAKADEQRARIEARKEAARASDDDDDDDDDGDDPGDGSDDGDDGDGEQAAAGKEKELVAAAKAKVRRPSARRIAEASGRPAVGDGNEQHISITAAAGVGYQTGEVIDLDGVAQAMHNQAVALPERSSKAKVARINLVASAEQITEATPQAEFEGIIDRLADPGQLDLLDLTAAGGWCTPSENDYTLFGLDGATGLFTAPSVTIRRGGINIPGYIGIDAADGALWSWSEDQDANNVAEVTTIARTGGVVTVTVEDEHSFISGQTVVVNSSNAALNGVVTVASTPSATTFTYALPGADVASAAATGTVTGQKGCARIPCPTWTDYRLRALGFCYEHGNMTDRAFPELGRRYVSLVGNASLHGQSAAQVAEIIAVHSEDVTMADVATDVYGELMSAVDLQVADYRSEHMISDRVVLEVLMPVWAKAILRANLAMRQGVDLLAVTDQQIAQHFAARSVRPQFLEDYQPLHDGTPATAWPTTIDFVIYPAGSFFLGNGGSIDLSVQRDSRLNATNDFTLAWAETFWLLGRRGPLARNVTVPTLNVDGVTGCCPTA